MEATLKLLWRGYRASNFEVYESHDTVGLIGILGDAFNAVIEFFDKALDVYFAAGTGFLGVIFLAGEAIGISEFKIARDLQRLTIEPVRRNVALLFLEGGIAIVVRL